MDVYLLLLSFLNFVFPFWFFASLGVVFCLCLFLILMFSLILFGFYLFFSLIKFRDYFPYLYYYLRDFVLIKKNYLRGFPCLDWIFFFLFQNTPTSLGLSRDKAKG